MVLAGLGRGIENMRRELLALGDYYISSILPRGEFEQANASGFDR
jgi:hypothetical protein